MLLWRLAHFFSVVFNGYSRFFYKAEGEARPWNAWRKHVLGPKKLQLYFVQMNLCRELPPMVWG